MADYSTEQVLQMIEENGGPRGLDLSGRHLAGIDLSLEQIKVELDRLGLASSSNWPLWVWWDLETGKLLGANLQGVNFQGSNLAEARLDSSNLTGANLAQACLKKARLQSAALARANLRSTDCEAADLRDADLYQADLSGASFQDTDLRGAYLRRSLGLWTASFPGAIMDETTKWPVGFPIPRAVHLVSGPALSLPWWKRLLKRP